MLQRITVLFLFVSSLNGYSHTTDKSKAIEAIISFIQNDDIEVVEDLHAIPDELFLKLQSILHDQYNEGKPDDDHIYFEIYDQFQPASRTYIQKGNGNYRRFNFAVQKEGLWLISYHVTTKRLSYNNIVFFEPKDSEYLVKSFQIAKGSRTVESLLGRLKEPNLVEILYPDALSDPFIIF